MNGVMRQYLLKEMQEAGFSVQETTVSVNDIIQSDEIFLTNAINGIRWIRQFRNKTFINTVTVEIYNRFIKTIHA